MITLDIHARAARAESAAVRCSAKTLLAAAQAGTLCAAGIALAHALAARGGIVPASALGMGLLFTLLISGGVRSAWLEPGVPFLARHLGLLFVPILVNAGLVWPLPAHLLAPIAATLALSAAAGLVVTGLAYQACCRTERP